MDTVISVSSASGAVLSSNATAYTYCCSSTMERSAEAKQANFIFLCVFFKITLIKQVRIKSKALTVDQKASDSENPHF